MAGIKLDRHYEILQLIVMDLPPLKDETPEETELRTQLEKEVNEMLAKGQIPSIPFD